MFIYRLCTQSTANAYNPAIDWSIYGLHAAFIYAVSRIYPVANSKAIR